MAIPCLFLPVPLAYKLMVNPCGPGSTKQMNIEFWANEYFITTKIRPGVYVVVLARLYNALVDTCGSGSKKKLYLIA